MSLLTLTLFYSLQGNSGPTDIYNTKVRQKSMSLVLPGILKHHLKLLQIGTCVELYNLQSIST